MHYYGVQWLSFAIDNKYAVWLELPCNFTSKSWPLRVHVPEKFNVISDNIIGCNDQVELGNLGL